VPIVCSAIGQVNALNNLAGLEYLRRAGVAPDARVAEAIELIASKRDREQVTPENG